MAAEPYISDCMNVVEPSADGLDGAAQPYAAGCVDAADGLSTDCLDGATQPYAAGCVDAVDGPSTDGLDGVAQPLVSIVIPAYNLEDYIVPCVKSALGQSWKNIEVIAVDDGSADSTGALLDALAKEDSRLRVIHKPNAGVALARKTGIDAASGEYLAFLDADDIYYPEFISRAMSAMSPAASPLSAASPAVGSSAAMPSSSMSPADGECDIVVEGLRRIHPGGTDSVIVNDIQEIVDGRTFMGLYFSQSIFIGLWNKVYRRELFRDIETRPYRIGEDFYVGCQVAAKLPRVKFIDYIGYGYFQRPGSNVHNSFDIAFCEDFCDGIGKSISSNSPVVSELPVLDRAELEGYTNLLRIRWYITYISKSRNHWIGDCDFAVRTRSAISGGGSAFGSGNGSANCIPVVCLESSSGVGSAADSSAGLALVRKYFPVSVILMLHMDRWKCLRPLVLAVAACRRIHNSILRRIKLISAMFKS